MMPLRVIMFFTRCRHYYYESSIDTAACLRLRRRDAVIRPFCLRWLPPLDMPDIVIIFVDTFAELPHPAPAYSAVADMPLRLLMLRALYAPRLFCRADILRFRRYASGFRYHIDA